MFNENEIIYLNNKLLELNEKKIKTNKNAPFLIKKVVFFSFFISAFFHFISQLYFMDLYSVGSINLKDNIDLSFVLGSFYYAISLSSFVHLCSIEFRSSFYERNFSVYLYIKDLLFYLMFSYLFVFSVLGFFLIESPFLFLIVNNLFFIYVFIYSANKSRHFITSFVTIYKNNKNNKNNKNELSNITLEINKIEDYVYKKITNLDEYLYVLFIAKKNKLPEIHNISMKKGQELVTNSKYESIEEFKEFLLKNKLQQNLFIETI